MITDSFSDNKGNILTASGYNLPGKWAAELLIALELQEADSETKLLLNHEGVPGEMHDECRQGWNDSFDKLEQNIK